MKQTIFTVAGGCILIFFLMILLALYGRSARQTEVKNALAEAVDTALSDLKEEDIKTDMDNETFIANFLEVLLAQLNSFSDIKVSVLDADAEKGILSVEVTESYKHPGGRSGTVSTVRTVIFEQEKKKNPISFCIDYYLDEDVLYKKFILTENSVCPIPAEPKLEGKNFLGWEFVTGGNGMVDSTEISYIESGGTKHVLSTNADPIGITENLALRAVFQ